MKLWWKDIQAEGMACTKSPMQDQFGTLQGEMHTKVIRQSNGQRGTVKYG